MRNYLPLTLAALCAGAFLFPSAALAQTGEIVNGGFGVGLGWAEPEEGGEGDILALIQYRGESWEVEFDYVFGDSEAWIVSGNYLYNFDRDLNQPDSGMYVGVGYSYISFSGGDGGSTAQQTTEDDGDDNDSGINVLLGYDFDKNWGMEGRYVFSDPNFFTLAVTYNFGADDENY